MKKSAKPLIANVLFISVISAVLIISYVSLKLNCEELVKEKVFAEEKLNSKNNFNTSLVARLQLLLAEERITSIAGDELGMVRKNNGSIKVTVSKDKIREISEEIDKKYD